MIGALIGAGASLLGGLLNKNSQDKQNQAAAQHAAQQEALQREFAQNSIQWKVADAEKAGIHPLYAIGAQGSSYTPSTFVGGADSSLGSAVASSGQDISRALQATRTTDERQSAFDKTVQALSVQKMGLENELLSSQIAKMRGQIGPPMPSLSNPGKIDGQQATVIPNDPKIGERPHLQLGENQKWFTDPHVTNADEAEKRYGEMTDFMVGPYNLWRDMVYNSAKTTLPWWGGKPLLRGGHLPGYKPTSYEERLRNARRYLKGK